MSLSGDSIVDRIVKGFSPRKIILFGSRARGTAAADSDVDLLVVANRVARRWIAKAEEDLAAAERLLSIDDSLAATACFHRQQAVEKRLKALLVFAGVPFARTHDVIQLVQMLPGHLALSIPLADLAPLNRYAVEARYPIGEEPLTGDEARAAIAVSRRVRAAVLPAVGPASPEA